MLPFGSIPFLPKPIDLHGRGIRLHASAQRDQANGGIMSNIDTVKQLYEAFGRGDIPAIIGKLDPNIEWDVEVPTPGVPWLQPRRGAANIPAFFESLEPLSFQRFDPHTFFADGNKVFALIAIDATHVASGKQYQFPYEGHLWFFNDAGKIVKYQHVTDTALHCRAAKGE
jgi:ketosteroid isomerase-like protein